MDYAKAGHLNRVNLLGMVSTEVRPGSCKFCGIYGHLGRNCRNRMMQDFNQGEISSTSSVEADNPLFRDKKLSVTNPNRAREPIKRMKKKKKKKRRKKKRKKKKKYSSSSSTSSSSNTSSSDSSSSTDRRTSRRRKIKKQRMLRYPGSEADVESMTEGVRRKLASRKKRDPMRRLSLQLKGFDIPDPNPSRKGKRKPPHLARKVKASSYSDQADVEESEATITKRTIRERPRLTGYQDLGSKKRQRDYSPSRGDRSKRRSSLSERRSSRRRYKRPLDTSSTSSVLPEFKKRAGKRMELIPNF